MNRITPPFWVGIAMLWALFLALLLPESVGAVKPIAVVVSILLAVWAFGSALARAIGRRRASHER